MAEAFEVAAGVFGVVSLSIQLAESVQKVKGFCDNVKDAPPRLADLIDEIEEMSDLVKDLENEHQPTGVVVTATMQRCINSSRKAVDYFETFANELQARLKKRRFSGGLKFALRQSDIEKMLNRLERAKTLLLFAYMQYQQGIQQKQHDDVRQDIKALASGQGAVLKLVQTGHASMDVDKYIHRQQLARSRQIFRVDTPAWLSNRIWQLALGRSLSGWHFTMRTYGVVPDDSLVFQACRAGDLVGMQRLFDVGLASPFDRNECGDDLLMVSLR